jgi:hypothetical protein
VVTCVEKLKVMRENLDEIRQLCQDAPDDAVLMGCDDAQFRALLSEIVRKLENRYNSRRAPEAYPSGYFRWAGGRSRMKA